jgi:excisionase family DNA binding protein
MALKSIQQAADMWGVSVHTARRLAAAGTVRTVTVGRRRLIPESEITRIATTGTKSPARRQKSEAGKE